MKLEIASANSNHLRDGTKRECSKLKQMLYQAKDDDVGSYLLETAGLATGDVDRAIADFDEAIRRNPQDDHAFNQRGLTWSFNGDNDRAIADYSEAIRLNPQLGSAFKNRAIAWSEKGENDRAIADFDEAIRLNPQEAVHFYLRAGEWSTKGEKDRAIADLDEAKLLMGDPIP